MKRARRKRDIWLAVVIVTAITGVAGLPGTVLGAVNHIYALMGASILLLIHGFFGITFYAIAYANAARDFRVMKAVSGGVHTLTDLSMNTGLPINVVGESLTRCMKRGYLEGYLFDGNALTEIVPKESKCEYCGRMVSSNTFECPSCGAPIKW